MFGNSKVGKFLNFEHYYLDSILKIIYLVSAIAIAFGAIAFCLSFSSRGAFDVLVGLIGGIFIFAFGELALRITFESILMFVQLAIDVRAIRSKFGKITDLDDALNSVGGTTISGESETLSSSPNPEPFAAQFSPGFVAPQSEPEPAQSQDAPAPDPNSWNCPNCGKHMNGGKYCIKCGSPRS